jgi:hypothetical protein
MVPEMRLRSAILMPIRGIKKKKNKKKKQEKFETGSAF